MTTKLHIGSVAHIRHASPAHRFSYRVWMLSVDLDAPSESLLFHRNRRGLVSLHDRDHGPRDGTPLRPWVQEQLAHVGLQSFAARIRFMAIPRVLGFAFNPIAFYFCYDAAGRLGAVIHQVKNTFGDQTAYVLAVPDAPGTIHQSCAKHMHVSPFFDMQGGYRFAFTSPDAPAFRLQLRYGTADAPRMTANMRLAAQPLSDRRLAWLLLAMPLMPMKVFFAIHWQALRLKLAGAIFHPAPPPHHPSTTGAAS